MSRSVNQRLMTVEEVMRLSDDASAREKSERPAFWSWQAVARAIAQRAKPVSEPEQYRSKRNLHS